MKKLMLSLLLAMPFAAFAMEEEGPKEGSVPGGTALAQALKGVDLQKTIENLGNNAGNEDANDDEFLGDPQQNEEFESGDQQSLAEESLVPTLSGVCDAFTIQMNQFGIRMDELGNRLENRVSTLETNMTTVQTQMATLMQLFGNQDKNKKEGAASTASKKPASKSQGGSLSPVEQRIERDLRILGYRHKFNKYKRAHTLRDRCEEIGERLDENLKKLMSYE